MKCNKIIVAFLMLAVFACFNASAVKAAKMKGNGLKQIVEYPGIELGKAIPDWVQTAMSGSEDELYNCKSLKLDGLQPFFTSDRGENLDFLKLSVGDVKIVGEVAQALTRIVDSNIDSNTEGMPTEVKQNIKKTLNISSKVKLVGLLKKAEFYIKVATSNNGKKLAKNLSNADYHYEYYVVYVIDKKMWDSQIRSALGDAAKSINKEVGDAELKAICKGVLEETSKPVVSDTALEMIAESSADDDFLAELGL